MRKITRILHDQRYNGVSFFQNILLKNYIHKNAPTDTISTINLPDGSNQRASADKLRAAIDVGRKQRPKQQMSCHFHCFL